MRKATGNTAFIFIFLLLLPTWLFSQQGNNAADSVFAAAEATLTDSSKNDLLYKAGFQLAYSQPEAALQVAERLRQNAEIQHIPLWKGWAYVITGLVNTNQGKISEAETNFKVASQIADSLGDKKLISSVNNNLGILFKKQGYYLKALEHYQIALALSSELNARGSIASLYNNIGSLYRNMGDTINALDFFQRSLYIRTELADTAGIAGIYNNIGNIYLDQSRYPQAIEYYKSAAEINLKEQNLKWLSANYDNIGKSYQRMGEQEQGLYYKQMGLEIRERIGDKHGMAASYTSIGRSHLEMGHPDLGLKYNKIAREVLQKINDRAAYKDTYHGLADAYAALKNFGEAYKYVKLYEKVRDSLADDERRQRLNDLSARFRLGEQAEAIKKLTEEKQDKNLIIFLSLIAFMITAGLATVLFYQFSTRKKINDQLRQQNRQVNEQNQMLARLNEEKNEFLNIATHDLNSPLNSILLSSRLLKKDLAEVENPMVHRMVDIIMVTSERMKSLISDLLDLSKIESGQLSMTITSVNIGELCQELLNEHAKWAFDKNIQMHCSIGESSHEGIFTDKGALLQILDNLVSNAIKFTPPGKNIYLIYEDLGDWMKFEIKDEGPGINETDQKKLFRKFTRLSARPTGGEHSTGLGLSIVKRLVDAMGGKVWCESAEGNGTSFFVHLKKAGPAPQA